MGKKIVLQNVQCSFPSVFRPNTKFGPDGKREITLLLNKTEHQSTIKQIEGYIQQMLGRVGNSSSVNICFKDGDMSGRDENFNHYTIKATNSEPIMVVDGRKRQLTEYDVEITGGDWVNAVIELYSYNHDFGSGVACKIIAVQYIKKGEFVKQSAIDSFNVFDIDGEPSAFDDF